MPTIYRPGKKKRVYRKDTNNAKRHEIYNTRRWRDMRSAILRERPLCPVCEARGRIEAATQVHHTSGFMNEDDSIDMLRAYDYRTLLPLCNVCHGMEHSRQGGRTQGFSLPALIRYEDQSGAYGVTAGYEYYTAHRDELGDIIEKYEYM